MKLYKDSTYKGNPENRHVAIDYSPKFTYCKWLPKHHTILAQSTLQHATHNNQILCVCHRVLVKETPFWKTKTRNITTIEEQ